MKDLNKIIEKAKNGDKKAFDKLYQHTQNEVWFTCLSLLKNEENAKDAMQNTYITAFVKMDTLTDNDKCVSWLKKIAVNTCKDYLKGKVVYQLDEEDYKDFAETDELMLPQEYITKSETRKIILNLLENTLSNTQYQTVLMYYYDELSIPDIAQIMECPEGTVMSRLFLARTKMKKAITDYEEENNDRLHGVVLLPFFNSVFKTESESLKVPVIKLNLPAVAGKKGFDIFTTGILSTTKSRVIAGVCTLAFVSGMATTAIIFMSGCGVPADEVIVETTEPTETVPEKVYDAVKDNDLKVDEKGNIVDSKGNKLEVNKDGEVKVTDSKGNSVYVKPETVKDVVENNGVVSKPSNSTQGKGNGSTGNQNAGNKPSGGNGSSSKSNSSTGKKPSSSSSSSSNVKATESATKADPNAVKTWHDAVYKTVTHPAVTETIHHPEEKKVVTHPEVTHEEPIYENKRIYVCNTCNADITEAVKKVNTGDSSLMNAHMNPHYEKGEKTSWHSEYREVQVGTKTVVDKPAWEEEVVTKKAWTEEKVIKEAWTEKVLETPAGWY